MTYQGYTIEKLTQQNTEIHKTRVLPNGWHIDMQVLYIEGEGYQATYFYGADPLTCCHCCTTAEEAAYQLDRKVDKPFGTGDHHYVQIGNRIPVGIKGINEASEFAKMWGGVLLTKSVVVK